MNELKLILHDWYCTSRRLPLSLLTWFLGFIFRVTSHRHLHLTRTNTSLPRSSTLFVPPRSCTFYCAIRFDMPHFLRCLFHGRPLPPRSPHASAAPRSRTPRCRDFETRKWTLLHENFHGRCAWRTRDALGRPVEGVAVVTSGRAVWWMDGSRGLCLCGNSWRYVIIKEMYIKKVITVCE